MATPVRTSATCSWAQGQTVDLAHQADSAPYTYTRANNDSAIPAVRYGDMYGDQTLYGDLCFYEGAADIEKSDYGEHLKDRMAAFSTLIVFASFGLYLRFRCKTCNKRYEAKGRKWKEEMDNMKKDRRQMGADARGQGDADVGVTTAQKWKGLIIMVMFAVMMTLQIFIGIQINQKTQYLLPATSRNAQIIAESILNPMNDIFSFLDDILLVKVGAALVVNDYAQMKKVFILGVFGGAAMGVIGALVATVFVLVPFLSQELLNPFGATAASGGCHLAANDDIGAVSVYFITSAWAWPFTFASFGLSGFAMALNNIEALLGISIIGMLVSFVGIMVIFPGDPRLEVLGYVRFAAAALPAFLWALYFAASKDLRVSIGLTSQAGHARAPMLAERRTAVHDFWSDPETKAAMKDGLLAMLVETTVELGRTITLYVAAKTIGIGGFYQISAHMAIQQSTGLALASGALINMKLQGPQLLGAGLHEHFLWLIEFCFVFCLIATGICALEIFTSQLKQVVDNGTQLGLFSSNVACFADYGGYFGTSESSFFNEPSFMTTVLSVPVVVLVRVFYLVSKSALYAMQDFAYMAQVSVAAFFFVFLPAVLLMGFLSKSAMVSVFVMTIPNMIAAIAFCARLKSHTDRLDSEDGHQHNKVYQRAQSALGSYGVNPAVDPPGGFAGAGGTATPETELSWGRTADADRVTGGPGGVMPPPS